MKNIFLYCSFILVLIADVNAQRSGKGNTADKPWMNAISNGNFANGKQDSVFYNELKFGSWSFRGVYGYSSVVSSAESGDEKPFGHTYTSVHNMELIVTYKNNFYNSINVKCTDPANNSFSIWFTLSDSIYESYYQEKGFPMDEKIPRRSDHYIRHYRKELKGFIKTTSNDSVPFSLVVNFENTRMNQRSFLFTVNDTIVVVPLSDSFFSSGRKTATGRNVFSGFEFYQHNKLISAANRKGVSDNARYSYWISPEPGIEIKQILAAMIFVIVGFVK